MADQQPQGTEYTLQGVMRFLQVEWHNHERTRNAWDIERAELKAKIAKQEGDFRNSKRLNVALDKQVRMMENALKAERAKPKAPPSDQPPPYQHDAQNLLNGEVDVPEGGLKKRAFEPAKYFTPNQASDDETRSTQEEKEALREDRKKYLQKCVEELTYMLTPPRDPPGPSSSKQQEIEAELEKQAQPTAEQLYDQQQMLKRNQQAGASHLPSLPNHHPPPIRQPPEYVNTAPQQPQPQTQPMTRQPSQPPPNYPPPLPDHIAEMRMERGQMPEQQAPQPQRPQQDFDLYGRQVTTRAEEIDPSQPLFADDDGGWNFDDANLPMESPLQAGPPPRRTDVNLFPSPNEIPQKSPTRTSHTRRRSSGSHGSQRMARKVSDGAHEIRDLSSQKDEPREFKVRFALRGHLDVIRSIIFTGGGSPSEPEICTASDDGTLKRWIIPANYSGLSNGNSQHPTQPPPDLDLQSNFTHRGHDGIVTSLAACPASPSFSTGGRALGDGWVFSGGEDATVRVWERGRVDPKATLDGHTDAIWALCVLPAPASSILGPESSALLPTSAAENRILLASGSADCSIRIWAVTAPPQLSNPQASSAAGSRRGVGGSRRHSITSGSNHSSEPQPSTASGTPFHNTLIHSISIPGSTGIPTCITPLGAAGESFVASYTDASVLIFDSRSGEQVVGMASAETYDNTAGTGTNSVVVTSALVDNVGNEEGEVASGGATGSSREGEVEGVVISGHEDRFVRFFDANSGQCTYSMLAHPASIASLSLSPDGHELVSAGHDASLRFWSLEKRSCIQEITSHRMFRSEGVVSVVWSSDGRWVVSGGGDGVVKVFGR